MNSYARSFKIFASIAAAPFLFALLSFILGVRELNSKSANFAAILSLGGILLPPLCGVGFLIHCWFIRKARKRVAAHAKLAR
ncbi:MAG: hypothetical protein EBX52_09270 [Proteobacteria bacterium]|nr:hypothetical protein [Pseudomonadota bacterium]